MFPDHWWITQCFNKNCNPSRQKILLLILGLDYSALMQKTFLSFPASSVKLLSQFRECSGLCSRSSTFQSWFTLENFTRSWLINGRSSPPILLSHGFIPLLLLCMTWAWSSSSSSHWKAELSQMRSYPHGRAQVEGTKGKAELEDKFTEGMTTWRGGWVIQLMVDVTLEKLFEYWNMWFEYHFA
jgi:hypothetical protein